MIRTRARFFVVLLGVALAACGTRAFADDRAPADRWPLGGAAPTKDAAAARAAIDAAQARRQTIGLARATTVLDEAVVVADPAAGGGGPGRVSVSAPVALRGLRVAAERAREADRRTVPEMMEVLAAVAFDGQAVPHDRAVLPGSGGKVDRIFSGSFRPQSIDDRPYVLQPSRLERLSRQPPAPPPPPPGAPEASLSERIVRGVRIDVDEGLLRRALEGADVVVEETVLDQLEERLLTARDGDAAVAALAGFVAERKQALLKRLEGADGLRRVSLKALLAGGAADPAATCGGLTRLLGVACDAAGDEVTLVGVVEPGAPPVPLDALVVALRCVWREGRVPGCSLDPDPADPGGPQKVRVLGVPADSRFAKTMLDADYAMKRIVGRAPGGETGVEGLVDLPGAFERLGGELGSNRFWLTPVPPAPGDVLAAPAANPGSFDSGGPAALFQARVRIRTEGMRAAAFGGEQGSGSGTPAAEACARSFSEHYDELAVRLPVFAELRTLFDTVTCAQVLRILAPKHPLLARAADRAYVKADVPRSYAGITVTTMLGSGPITLQGGCELDPRVTERAFLDVPHPAFAALAARGGDGALPGGRPVPVGLAPGGDDLLLAATQLLAAERYAEARDALSELLAVRPDDPEALSLRATARFLGAAKQQDGEGERARGLLEAEESHLLDPNSPTLEATWRHLRHLAGDRTAFATLRPAVAESLEGFYMATAATQALARKWPEALASAARAVEARPSSVPARVLRATVLWLSDDLVAGAGAAAEAAALDPSSPEPLAVSAWIALQRGDVRGALASFDRAIALQKDAEKLGMRALARALENDLAGAAVDLAEAIALDPTDRAVGLAMQTFRGMAVYGAEKGRAVARAQLMLPCAVQMALYEGQRAMETQQPRVAVEAFERALRGLEGNIPPERLQTSLAVETVSFLVARASIDLRGVDPEAGDRIEARAAAIAALHPSWVAPHWLRALAAQKAGKVVEALDQYARVREGDPSKDELLQQSLPRDPAAFRRILAILEVSLTLGAPAEEGERRMPAALARLVGAYRGTSSEAAAEGVKVTLDAMTKKGDAASRAALRVALRERSARLAATDGSALEPSEAMARAFFHALVVGTEAEASKDEDSAPAAADAGAGALKTLAALAPVPDIYESVQNVIVSARKEALQAALGTLLGAPELNVNPALLVEVALAEPPRVEQYVDRVFRPVRERAKAYGDPVLLWLVEEAAVGAGEGTFSKARAVRLNRVERVLAVALDSQKVLRLAAARDRLKAEQEQADAAASTRRTAARHAVLAALRSPCDVKTLQALLAGQREGGAAAEFAPGLEDARRLQQVTLAAYLRALNVPLPEALK